ncbi:MAG: alpha/beta fold hydrolase [Streptosporangiaceae bacterium]
MKAELTFVLVHGGFHGGWCWRRVADRMRAAGHRVFTPTLTGLGERAHLLDERVGVETFVADVVGVLEAEELTDVVLVGHSHGGMSITGAADRVPDRIRRLVYLDALIVEDGHTGFDEIPPGVVAERIDQAKEFSGGVAMPPFSPDAFAVTDPADSAWLRRRLTPHPVRSYRDTVALRHPVGNGLPCTYIACTHPFYPPLESSRRWARARSDWEWREIGTGHDAMIIAPEMLTQTLIDTASR